MNKPYKPYFSPGRTHPRSSRWFHAPSSRIMEVLRDDPDDENRRICKAVGQKTPEESIDRRELILPPGYVGTSVSRA